MQQEESVLSLSTSAVTGPKEWGRELLTRRELMALAPLARLANAAPSPAGNLLWDYFLRELTAADDRRRVRMASLETPSELAALRTRVRAQMTGAIGAFPERTPLNARETGVIVRSDYVIEKIVFESRPRFYVSANVYRPKSGTMRRPAVIQSCGHYLEGKAAPDYQRACVGLAKKGFVVLVYDPLGQGERLMYKELWEKNPKASATAEHNIAGRPCFLLGRTLAHYRIWDAMRALDYLESRPDVDKTRLGMFGHSGGGLLTLLTAPLENRLRAVMSCCAVTSFYHKFRAFLPGDPEQVVPKIYERGIDHPELIASVAPRAFLIGAALRDYVPLDGVRRTYKEAQKAYAIAGVPGRLGKVETDNIHKLDKVLREACYAWMQKHLAGESGDSREPDFQIETPEELRCTANGRVMDLREARGVFDLNLECARRLEVSRRARPRPDVPRVLGLPSVQPEPRRLGGAPAEFRIVSEPGIELPASLAGPRPAGVLLVLAAERGRKSPDAVTITRRLVEAGYPVLSLDLRGWGETAPLTESRPGRPLGEDFFAVHAIELGRPLLGMRVQDLAAAARLMRGHSRKVYLIGLDGAGLVALHAAAIDSRIAGVAAVRTLAAYQDVLEHPYPSEPLASFLPGVLAEYDLPDLARGIAPRPAVSVGPCDSSRRPLKGVLSEESVVREILSGLRLRR